MRTGYGQNLLFTTLNYANLELEKYANNNFYCIDIMLNHTDKNSKNKIISYTSFHHNNKVKSGIIIRFYLIAFTISSPYIYT